MVAAPPYVYVSMNKTSLVSVEKEIKNKYETCFSPCIDGNVTPYKPAKHVTCYISVYSMLIVITHIIYVKLDSYNVTPFSVPRLNFS